MIFYILINNVFICLTNILTFALKQYGQKWFIVSIKSGKLKMMEKLCLVNLFKFHKKKTSFTQVLASEKPPEKYTIFDATIPHSLKI